MPVLYFDMVLFLYLVDLAAFRLTPKYQSLFVYNEGQTYNFKCTRLQQDLLFIQSVNWIQISRDSPVTIFITVPLKNSLHQMPEAFRQLYSQLPPTWPYLRAAVLVRKLHPPERTQIRHSSAIWWQE
jgi:hypothetical protein